MGKSPEKSPDFPISVQILKLLPRLQRLTESGTKELAMLCLGRQRRFRFHGIFDTNFSGSSLGIPRNMFNNCIKLSILITTRTITTITTITINTIGKPRIIIHLLICHGYSIDSPMKNGIKSGSNQHEKIGEKRSRRPTSIFGLFITSD